MRFVLAAGGSGTRMLPATKFINKHLIPVGNGKLMIDLPLGFLADHKIKEVCVVTGSNHASQICEYLGDGERYGLDRIEYFMQAKPAGIADVLTRISHRSNQEGVCLILGDNYFEETQVGLSDLIKQSETASIYQQALDGKDPNHAVCWEYDLGNSEEASRFGQVIRNDKNEPVSIVEKPDNPVHGRILTGLYYFPYDVFYKVKTLTPSKRNELEITHLLDLYLKEKRLAVKGVTGRWCDLGENETWMEFVSRRENEQH